MYSFLIVFGRINVTYMLGYFREYREIDTVKNHIPITYIEAYFREYRDTNIIIIYSIVYYIYFIAHSFTQAKITLKSILV